jgi:hypothetical protein
MVSSRPSTARLDALRQFAVAVALAALVVFAYRLAPAIGFLSDDFVILSRLTDFSGLWSGPDYFGLAHFEYYRPVAFLSYALDWHLWARSPAGYHVSSLALHVLNTLLVLALARRFMGWWPSVAAAAIFALHPSNHEAVYWIAARFDLLATAAFLLGLLALRGAGIRHDVLAAAGFLIALLCKESAVAFPAVAFAFSASVHEASLSRLVRQLLLFALGAGVYLWLRRGAGLEALGGAARVPKLAMVAGLVLVALHAARLGWPRLQRSLAESRVQFAAIVVLVVSVVGLIGASGLLGAPVRRTLASVAFFTIHLLSPVSVPRLVGTLPAGSWLAGLAAVIVAALAVLLAWRALVERPMVGFALIFLVAALIPVSSLTEGTRFLYLASVPVSLLAGLLLESLSTRVLRPAWVVVVIVLAAGAVSIDARGRDWVWASRMSDQSVATIVEALGPSCTGRRVVLAVAPERLRGVYCDLNPDSLAWLRQCRPADMFTIVALGHDDPVITANWESPSVLTMELASYPGGFVTWRNPQRRDAEIGLATSTFGRSRVGVLYAKPHDGRLDIRQTVARHSEDGTDAWFVFSDGRLVAVPQAVR